MIRRIKILLIDGAALFCIMLLAMVGQLWSAVLTAAVAALWAVMAYYQGLSWRSPESESTE